MVKFVALAIVFTVLPLAYLIWNWQQAHRVMKTLFIVYLLILSACLYPVTSFLSSLTKIEEVFPKDCDAALRLSKEALAKPYPAVQSAFLKALFGFTPSYYFHSTIAICEFKKQNYEAAVLAFEGALADSDSVDAKSRSKLEDGLREAKSYLD